MGTVMLRGASRVWTIRHRAGPTHEPYYHQQGAAGTISWPQGDVTKIEIPSDVSYNQWEQIDSFQNSPDRATTTIQVYETEERSQVYELIRQRCPFDIQFHVGLCEDPRNFDLGWQKVKVFEDARGTSYDTNEQGALEGSNQDKIMEDLPISARSVYDILRMTYREVAKNEVGEIVTAVSVCDQIACGDCDDASDGCQRVIALCDSATSSPGILPQLIITTDQFGTDPIIESFISSFTLGEHANDGDCVGPYYVAVSYDGESIHYASLEELVLGTETWAEVTTGFEAGHGPNAIWNYSPSLSILVGVGGYVYIMKNPADGVVVLDAGSTTTEDLNDVDGKGTEHIAAVGDAGAFIYSTDGANFTLANAPVGPTDLYAVAYRKTKEIWVGGDTGSVYVTSNYGLSYTTKALPGNLTTIDKILWENETVGWIAGHTASAGKLLRTINGGYSWYVVPEAARLTIPANDYLTSLAVCENEPNKVFAGGLADNASDGILIKGSD